MLWTVLVGLFVASQVVYAAINLAVIWVLYRRPRQMVEDRRPEEFRDVHVLMPVYHESREVVEETLRHLQTQAYPMEKLHVYMIYEADGSDPAAERYVHEFVRQFAMDVTPVAVHRSAPINKHITSHLTLESLPRNKAYALQYGIHVLKLPEDDIVTVFDADTIAPQDLFRQAVAGLEDYDIVQAKQTARNVHDGVLPMLEGMGMAAWSHIIYPHTAAEGPYQLLGKGYFMDVTTLYGLEGWDVTEATEDMALGLDAAQAGLTLGVIDRYIQDLCPTSLPAWVKQKRRWVAGPYRALRTHTFSASEKVRFLAYTLANQALSLNNVIGLPTGLFVVWATLFGPGITLPLWMWAVTVFNFVNWVYYSVRSYWATHRALVFPRDWLRGLYYYLSNPVSQVFYSTLWALPIALAVGDEVRGTEQGFEVTPK